MPAYYIIEENAGRIAFIRKVNAKTEGDALQLDAEDAGQSIGHTIIHAEDMLSIRAVLVSANDPATDPAAIYRDPPVAKGAPKVRMVCDTCGSDDVRADAFAAWDVETQAWVLASTYDATHCEHCGCERDLEEQEIDASAAELDEIDLPSAHDYKDIDELRAMLPAGVAVQERDKDDGWEWTSEQMQAQAGPFKNMRSAIADYLNKHGAK